MEVLLWLSVTLNLIGLSCSLWAGITAKSRYEAVRKLLDSSSARSLAAVDAEVLSLAASLSSVTTTVRRLSSRIGMQATRERQKAESMPENLTPAERKAWLRRGLQTGQLQIHRDGSPPTTSKGAVAPAADDDIRH